MSEKEIVLPTKVVPAEHKSPSNLIIFSKPKVGKTSLFSQLENCLILDLEKGSKYVDALKITAESVEDIEKIGKKIIEAGRPYDYIAVDTITALEEMCVPYAEILYARTSMGKNWFKRDEKGFLTPDSGKMQYGNILNLPNGAGYSYLREAFTKITDFIKTWAPRVIFSGHVKDTILDKNGSDFSSLDLDLTGKLKRITTSESDAIGYLYRKGNKNILSFMTKDEVACGARPDHLKNKEIVLSEMIDGKLVTYWKDIFID